MDKEASRRIIQITASSEGKTTRALLYALCDDGSIWQLARAEDCHWVKLPNIPQPEISNASAGPGGEKE